MSNDSGLLMNRAKKDQNKVNINHISYNIKADQEKSYRSSTQIPNSIIERLRTHLISDNQKVLQEAFLNDSRKNELGQIIARYISKENIVVKGFTAEQLQTQLVDAVAGMGVIQPLVEDIDITEIMINGKDEIIIEKAGKEIKTDIKFRSNEDLREIASKIVNASGQTLTAAKPYVDCRFPSMRINIVDHHIAGLGICITIRKFAPVLRINQKTMIESSQANRKMLNAMEAFIKGKLNVLIVGPTGSGKTELLKWMLSHVPDHERTLTLEDTAEMYLRHIYPEKHILPMECRFTDDPDTTVDFEILLKNALRQNPTRIIVGESRGPEALMMLEILNTGHPGCTTIHANNAPDAVDRLIMMCLRAGIKLDREIVGKWVTKVFDIVIFQQKMDDGERRIVEMIELVDFANDDVLYNPLFEFEETKIEQHNGRTTRIEGAHVNRGRLQEDTVKRILKSGVDPRLIETIIGERDEKELNLDELSVVHA